MSWGAIIGAGASLLGGILGRKSEKKALAAQNAYNHPSAIRERYESAGFNPLLGIAPGVDTQNGIGNPSLMGQGIANAGLALADGMDKAQMIKIEKAKLAQDQQKLDVLIQNATIRPRSGGVYAGNVSAPSAGGVGAKRGASLVPSRDVFTSMGGDVFDTRHPDFKPKAESSTSVYKTTSGPVVEVPLGPDLDEAATGAAIEAIGAVKASPHYKPVLANAGTMWNTTKYSTNPLYGIARGIQAGAVAYDLSKLTGHRARDPKVVKNDAEIKRLLGADYFTPQDYKKGKKW